MEAQESRLLNIKPAAQSDAETVARIICESFKKQAQLLELTPESCPAYVAFETAVGVRRRIESGTHVTVALLAGVPIGTVSCLLREDRSCGEIMRLAVLPEHRGNDHGSVLMAYAEQYLLAQGATAVEISIVAQFQRLQRYYEDLGYSVSDRRRVSTLPFELLFLVKQLTKSPPNASAS